MKKCDCYYCIHKNGKSNFDGTTNYKCLKKDDYYFYYDPYKINEKYIIDCDYFEQEPLWCNKTEKYEKVSWNYSLGEYVKSYSFKCNDCSNALDYSVEPDSFCHKCFSRNVTIKRLI